MNKKYYLWGAGGLGRRLYPRIPLQIIKGIIDSDKTKFGEQIGEFTVTPYDKEVIGDCGIIIVCFNSSAVEKKLSNDGVPFLRLSQFYTDWYWHTHKQNALSFVDLPITSRCTLKCKHCMQYLPLRGAGSDVSAEEIIAWWDRLVYLYPQIMEVSIMGGEPFLHLKIDEIIEHIANSSDISIVVTTNGMVMPTDSVIEKLKKNNVFVSISDYSNTLPTVKEKIDNFQAKLKQRGIQAERKTHLWIDQGKFDCKIESDSYDCARTHFQLADNRLWYCTLQCAGNKAGLCPAQDGIDYIELSNKYTSLELYQFSNDNIKTTICKNCGSRHGRSVPVAEQV